MYSIADVFSAATNWVRAGLHKRRSPGQWAGVAGVCLVFTYFGTIGVLLLAALLR